MRLGEPRSSVRMSRYGGAVPRYEAKDSRIVETVAEGTGALPKVGDKLLVHYDGCLASDGSCFDSSRARGHAFTFVVGCGKGRPLRTA